MNMEKMKAVFADEAFIKQLFELETAVQVQAALKEKGVELTEQEILSVREALVKMDNAEISAEQLEQWSKQADRGELPEEMLEYVAGGVVVASVIGAIISVVCYAGAAAGGAAVGVASYNLITGRRGW